MGLGSGLHDKMPLGLFLRFVGGPDPAGVCRRGAAWGLAGLVKGLGIGSLKKLGILDRVKAATEDQVSRASASAVCSEGHTSPYQLLLHTCDECGSIAFFNKTNRKVTNDTSW